MADLDVPIALRRPRRSNAGTMEPGGGAHLAAPKTPRRDKRAVRFSDPGPSAHASSGLTPMVRRTSIGTPRRHRASTPSRTGRGAAPAPQAAAALPTRCLNHTADGRVERRIRRANLRELLNKLEQQKKRSAKLAHSEIVQLKAEIKARDRDIYELQNATVIMDTERIWDLEQQIGELKEQLERRTAADSSHAQSRTYDWTLAARDPFSDDLTEAASDEDHFGDFTVAQLAASTPSRARSSFPTPPATSPGLPATPCWRAPLAPPVQAHTGVQACFPDPDRERLEEELASLRLEVDKLTGTLDSYKALGERIVARHGSPGTPASGAADARSSLEVLERQVECLAQTMSDRTAALAHLTAGIADLGFPGSDAGEMMAALASGFRAARLELEYLTPGEIALPLTSHGAEVLDLLLGRLRDLAKRALEDEASIDEYHEIEQSLRKQLDARVSVMEGLKAEMAQAERLMGEKNAKIQELRVGNERLRGAVDGYVRDLSELEKLVERIEDEGRAASATHAAQQESDREALAARDAGAAELEEKLAEALRQTARLQREMGEVQDSTTRHVVTINKQHGAALALRDARVMELRGEVDRVNEALRAAHETIQALRVDKGELVARMEGEKRKAKGAVDAMKGELQRVLQMSQEFLNSPRKDAGPDVKDGPAAAAVVAGPPSPTSWARPVMRSGEFLSAAPVRRSSGTKKPGGRRHDSGMGLMEDEEVDF